MNNGSLTSMITLTFPDEISEGIASETSAMLRPFRILFKFDKPIGKITYVFFNPKVGKSLLVGCFCYTPGNRLLFFPAMNGRKILWNTSQRDDPLPQGQVDHITYEPKLNTSHVTTLIGSKKETKWMKGFKLVDLEDGLKLWFGMSIQTLDVLEKMPHEVRWIFTGSESDINRRTNLVMSSRDNSVWNLIELPQPEEKFNSDSFIHFDIFIEKKKYLFSKEKNYITVAPHDKPSLITKIDLREKCPIRVHEVNVDGFRDKIIIAVSKHPGKLSEQVVISTSVNHSSY